LQRQQFNLKPADSGCKTALANQCGLGSPQWVAVTVYSLAQAKDQLSRLIDEALRGEIVTITRHGEPVVALVPSGPAPQLTAEYLKEMRRRAEARPGLGDSVTLVKQARDEEP
jgi:prevent-host-death family protein